MKYVTWSLIIILLSSSLSLVSDFQAVNMEDNDFGILQLQDEVTLSISFLTYLGGDRSDWLRDVCFDEDGNIWVLGYTESSDLPVIDPVQESYGGGGDALLAKYSSDFQLEFCTYLGGDGTDYGMALSTDPDGNIVAIGNTQSTNFYTLNAIQSDLNGTSDAFITKFDTDGTVLYSSYFGGSGEDFFYKIRFNSNGNYLLAGSTGSEGLPITDGVLQDTYGGGQSDIMMLCLTPNGQEIVFCSYHGGTGMDDAFAMELDSDGNIAVLGITSNNDTVTAGTYQQEYGGGESDAIVAKFTSDCDSVLWSTIIGGDGWEFGDGILFDSEDNLIISGYSGSSNFPLVNPLVEDQDDYDAFLARLSDDGSDLLFSTHLGGDGEDRSYGLHDYMNDSTIILCDAGSDGMPVHNPLQQNKSGGVDAYLAIFNTADHLVYGTYIGGSQGDYATGLEVSDNHLIAMTGYSSSDDLPVVNPSQDERGGSRDGFLCILKQTDDTDTFVLDMDVLLLIAIGGIGVIALVSFIVIFMKRINKTSG